MRAISALRRGATQSRPSGIGSAAGSFGELLQGALPGPDGDFLVTLPIARWSVATFHREPGRAGIRVWPAHKHKAHRLASMVAYGLPEPAGGTLTIASALPEGKGLASSSADLVATARAVAAASGASIPTARLEALLRQIEPTDGVLYPAVVAYHHRAVRLHAVLGAVPAMTIVGIDEGGTVDTVAANRNPRPFSDLERHEYARLLARLSDALVAGDLREVGAVATRSALMNQAYRPKRSLDLVVDLGRRLGALGVVAAHSGTMLGLLFDAGDPAGAGRVGRATAQCRTLVPSGQVEVFQTLTRAESIPGAHTLTWAEADAGAGVYGRGGGEGADHRVRGAAVAREFGLEQGAEEERVLRQLGDAYLAGVVEPGET